MKDYRQRFSGKADLYAAGRPSYAADFLLELSEKYGVGAGCAAADIGSGTGILTRQMLELGCEVYAVEPNEDMRRIAERDLGSCPGFHSVHGDAAETKLPPHSMDIITAAQAFHWFPVEAFRRECLRIGKPGCMVFLIWNQRDMEAEVTRELERLYKQFGKDFHGFNLGLQKDDPRIRDFFCGKYQETDYANPLYYDRAGFVTRCLSSSHSPQAGEPHFEEYIEEVNQIFDRFASGGRLEVPNWTTVYYGRTSPCHPF